MIKSLNILLIEDDAIEVMKFNRVVKTLNLNHKIIEANNGEEALEILRVKEVIPDIILLDLNMPKLNGLEFLRILKNDDTLKFIPSIMLTTSSNHKDLLECYKIGIAGYLLKPLKYDDYMERIKKLLDYWSINELISQ
ncbi:response regulator [Flavobacterium glaciei]|uniref:Response regulator receiver domain-containing protein n=1 Tax=Flavobacterium glaciei TaxID=386300 RepID=A0A562PKU1_9FLAO|nr:response regulator [Flavobacterium glaciei]RDI50373.1 response regulator receiver domain-containing protein [Flavobacterium glaciei]TWI44656.1 response regulator receiver domain-containing protein [Flavobacterium glaciei]